ncbi:MAG: Gldg family protein, partial [Marinilabiliaceae bacterium]
MIDLFKKEIATFFCSAMGYLVVSVFLVATWLLIWVIPSEYNVIYGGYATLSPLFDIAPWIYLFLVPAISMRLIAEERRQGTLELLLIRPQPAWRIVVAKYAAGLTLVLASIAPTLVYVSVVCSLGAPQGNIDMGGTIGSYLALILLAATYMSAGVFASSITSNQIVAFIVGAALCAFIYVGFDMVAALSPQSDWGAALMWLGLAEHYSSVSRGVLDVQDGVYFMSVCAIFISVTSLTLSRDRGRWRSFASVTGVAVIACVASSFFHFRLDLTSEKRYTLSDVSIGYADSLSHPVSVKLYLDGELNPGFRRLRRQTIELCRELSYASSKGVRVATEDPSEMEKGESREFALELSKNGLSGIPVFETKEDGQKTRTVVYPFAKVSIGDNSTWINLLENVQGLSGDESLNRSIEGIEYKLTDAIARLSRPSTPKIAFLEGHGELDEYDVLDATDELAKYFEV